MFEKGWIDPWRNQCLTALSYTYHAEIIVSLLPDFYSKELKLPHTILLGIHLKNSHSSLLLIIAIVLLSICAFLFDFGIWHQTNVYLPVQFLNALFSWINLAHHASLTFNSSLLIYHRSRVVCSYLHYYCLSYSSFQGPLHPKGFGLC